MSENIDALAAFLKARYDEAEASARGHLCINCGVPTAPLRSALGITGYTHDGRAGINAADTWQGVRCRRKITGADPVQNRARRLREVAAGRAIIAMYENPGTYDVPGDVIVQLGTVFSDHPDYRPSFTPEGALNA
jgi:Family of unknown function (DUF6221)